MRSLHTQKLEAKKVRNDVEQMQSVPISRPQASRDC